MENAVIEGAFLFARDLASTAPPPAAEQFMRSSRAEGLVRSTDVGGYNHVASNIYPKSLLSFPLTIDPPPSQDACLLSKIDKALGRHGS